MKNNNTNTSNSGKQNVQVRIAFLEHEVGVTERLFQVVTINGGREGSFASITRMKGNWVLQVPEMKLELVSANYINLYSALVQIMNKHENSVLDYAVSTDGSLENYVKTDRRQFYFALMQPNKHDR